MKEFPNMLKQVHICDTVKFQAEIKKGMFGESTPIDLDDLCVFTHILVDAARVGCYRSWSKSCKSMSFGAWRKAQEHVVNLPYRRK